MTFIRPSKRDMLSIGGILAAGVASPALLTRRASAQEKGVGEKIKELVTGENKQEVTPPEDLMREHGVLHRVLLLYEAGMRRLASKDDFDPALISRSAEIVRDFINDYHEKSEENHVFPRFKQAGQMTDLVGTLLLQHDASRNLTQTILKLVPASRNDGDDRRRLLAAMQSFITMYRPHSAREDTDLFPKLQKLVSAHEYDAMAEEFEKEERRQFGEDGFEKMTARVAQLEQQMGIYDLNQFTPR
jgi:hemerythrin-like domain-containing protein